MFRTCPDDFTDVDRLFLGEAEDSIDELVRDIEEKRPRRVYPSKGYPVLDTSPVPAWELIDLNDYAAMSVQFSRGCPFNCEFCDVVVMNGRVPRLKRNEQVIAELEALYSRGWRGSVFIVDDNFIGNKAAVKQLLPNIVAWQKGRERHFNFFTEASVNLADDPQLMHLMAEAGFNKVFLGLETPSEESLRECGKMQNLGRSLSDAVSIIHGYGMAVMGGFIIGFDNDPPDIFQRQINFIQKNGIVTAMIGLLTAIPGTRLYSRLESEGRLLFGASSGDNTDAGGALNFRTKMDRNELINGYRQLMNNIYSPDVFYKRMLAFLSKYRPSAKTYLERNDFLTFVRSLWHLGIQDKDWRSYYWKLLQKGAFKYRDSFSDVITMAIYGYHFRKLFCTNYPKGVIFPPNLTDFSRRDHNESLFVP
ncbi:MAG: radical SAM protein [Syntrophobacteraceae bacterium]